VLLADQPQRCHPRTRDPCRPLPPPPQGAGLRPTLLRASVRDVLLRGSFECDGACSPDGGGGGDSGVGVPGVLSMGACFLEGPQEDAALYLRGRYAASVHAAARGAAPGLPPLPQQLHAPHAL
jgi:hypothetical protein